MDKEEVKIAFVHALKAVDCIKQREATLKEFAKVMFEMTDQEFENNQVKSVANDPE